MYNLCPLRQKSFFSWAISHFTHDKFYPCKKTLQEHNIQKTHRLSVEDAESFVTQKERGHLSIQQQLQVQAKDTLAKNHLILKSILRAIVFCGKQNIALRSHNEQCTFDMQEFSASNPGNFKALLQLQIESGDKVLKDHVVQKMHSIALLQFKMSL